MSPLIVYFFCNPDRFHQSARVARIYTKEGDGNNMKKVENWQRFVLC
jgi:hypothetical protein